MENKLNPNLITSGERNVTFKVEGYEDGQGFLSETNKDNKHTIVLISEWWGLNKSITLTADEFASLGFKVLVPDVYRGKTATSMEDAGHLFKGLNWEQAVADILSSVKYLKEQGAEKIAVVGFCMGGALAIAAAATDSSNLDALVPFYGVPDLTKYKVENIKVPVLAQFPELDNHQGFSDPETAKRFTEAVKNVGGDIKLNMWAGADHAFMNRDSPRYNAEKAKEAREDTSKFLKNLFGANKA